MRRLALLGALALVLLSPAAARAAQGTVEGTVEPLAWAPEVEVCLAEGRPSETCTVPKADGSYALEVPLAPVKIEFLPSYRSRLLIQYYDHKASLNAASTINLTAAQPKRANIDADLVEAGAIEGAVTAATGGKPLSEVEACAVSVALPVVRSCDETDASGEYELHSLPAGSYRVGFWGRGKSAAFEPQYYLGKPSLAQATPVAVTAGATTGAIDVALAKGAQIEGVVAAAATGGPLGGIAVCLFLELAAKPERCTYSEPGGGYAFVGLPSGAYQVGFSLEPDEVGGEEAAGETDGFQTQYFANVASRSAAQTVALLPGSVASGVDASLSPPALPAPPAPAPVVSSPVVAAAPPVSEPKQKPKRKRCKKGYRKKKVNSRVRCVKVRKHKEQGRARGAR